MDDIVPSLYAWSLTHEAFLHMCVGGFAGILVPLIFATRLILIHVGSITCFSGRWRPFSPNWITVYSLLGTLIAAALYVRGDVTAAVSLACFAGILDRIDGRMAHVLDQKMDPPHTWNLTDDGLWWATHTCLSTKDRSLEVCGKTWQSKLSVEMNFPGGTDLGQVLDPALDKVKTFVLLAIFVHAGLILLPLVIVLAIPEIIGTLMRRPFMIQLQEPKATTAGKWKTIVQWITLIVAVPFHQGWFTDTWELTQQRQIMDVLLVINIALALWSVSSRWRDSTPPGGGKNIFSHT